MSRLPSSRANATHRLFRGLPYLQVIISASSFALAIIFTLRFSNLSYAAQFRL